MDEKLQGQLRELGHVIQIRVCRFDVNVMLNLSIIT